MKSRVGSAKSVFDMALFYDLHNHSCLSPCADDDLTPGNLAGLGALAGIRVMALTDHNSVKNCPSFFAAAKEVGIVPVAGMELTTAEDIHVVCLFETLEAALDFGETAEAHRVRIKNRPDRFGGRQIICDETDTPCGEEPDFLSMATDVSLEEVPRLVAPFGGISYPAHIDREANGLIAVLGTVPEEYPFPCAELYRLEEAEVYRARYPVLQNKRFVTGSDAHFLTAVREACASFPGKEASDDAVRASLFAWLRGETP